MTRHLTTNEIRLLQDVFKNTLNYTRISCTINKLDFGGEWNSVTPAGVPYFSRHIYCDDFSSAVVDYQWTFVHELAHVWQWQHGTYVTNEAIGLAIRFGKNYDPDAYPYDLAPGKKLEDYNIEQQASIVADYWGLYTKKTSPRDNNNKSATINDYSGLIAQLHRSGPPTSQMDRIPL